MTNFSLDQYWFHVEQQFQQASDALATGDSAALLESCEGLQQLSVELVQFLGSRASVGQWGPAELQRMQGLVAQLPVLRETLHRRNAHIALALQTLVPAAPREAIYGAEGSKTGATIYGTIPRKSGSFQAISA